MKMRLKDLSEVTAAEVSVMIEWDTKLLLQRKNNKNMDLEKCPNLSFRPLKILGFFKLMKQDFALP